MGNKVILSADSTCDMSPELYQKYNIVHIPLYITFGEKSFRDGVDITPDELYQKVNNEGIMPKTSAISVGDFIEYFENLLKDGDQVVHFSLSSSLSCTYQNALLAANEFDGKVFIVDTLNLSTAEALTVLYAADLRDAGAGANEIVEKAQAYAKRVDASFIVDNLEFLRKGGRCSALSALGANLLSIKPCIEVKDGKMDVGKKYRGKFKMVLQKYIEERLAEGNFDTTRIFVTHAGCADDVVQMAYQAALDTGIFSEVILARAGCTISSHCGPDTLGILFAHNE